MQRTDGRLAAQAAAQRALASRGAGFRAGTAVHGRAAATTTTGRPQLAVARGLLAANAAAMPVRGASAGTAGKGKGGVHGVRTSASMLMLMTGRR
jgi:hypothetical protein